MLGCRVNDNKLESGSLFGINPGSFVRYEIIYLVQVDQRIKIDIAILSNPICAIITHYCWLLVAVFLPLHRCKNFCLVDISITYMCSTQGTTDKCKRWRWQNSGQVRPDFPDIIHVILPSLPLWGLPSPKNRGGADAHMTDICPSWPLHTHSLPTVTSIE